MVTPMWEVRKVERDQAELFRTTISRGFGNDPSIDEGASERFGAIFDLDRMFAAFDGEEMVGTAGAFSLGLTLPGGVETPMGGTTIITVKPTHRRRGILRALMAAHLDDVREKEEAIAGLWASETTIYGRFGFGPATHRLSLEINAPRLGLESATTGDVRLVEAEEASKILPIIYEAERLRRPGMLSRNEAWWTHRRMYDGPSDRGGRSDRRYAVYTESGVPKGYATYRQKPEWDNWVAKGEVDVIEVITSSGEAHRAIWSFLTNIDLFPKVDYWNAAIDDPILMAAVDLRAVKATRGDALWLRLMDVPRALEARSYNGDGSLVIGVDDDQAYLLEVDEGDALCAPTDRLPDVTMSLATLGRLFMGGASATSAQEAGLITGEPGVAAEMDSLFRGAREPWCPEVF